MPGRDRFRPLRMDRVALVSTADDLTTMLECAADNGMVELDLGTGANRGAAQSSADVADRETELARVAAGCDVRGPVAAVAAWVPRPARDRLARDLSAVGASVVPLPRPAGGQPPTLLARGPGRVFDPLVTTYATVPYANIDPSLVAGLAYVLMFGMMFGDVGHGLILLLAALVVRSGRIKKLEKLRKAWIFVAGAGAAGIVFGALYGEAFGPTGLVPVLWLAPLEDPVPLLLSAVGVGAGLLSVAYGFGVVNRVREGGWPYALYARSGVAGSLLFGALGVIVAGVYWNVWWVLVAGGALALFGAVLVFVGLLAASEGGGAGVMQAAVELFDLVIRLASNLVSFARLAAFGLTHAALSQVVWQGTRDLWGSPASAVAAVALFGLGNLAAFCLEALVAGVQALRLEYYELFSRVFEQEGRPFRPWRLPPLDLFSAVTRPQTADRQHKLEKKEVAR